MEIGSIVLLHSLLASGTIITSGSTKRQLNTIRACIAIKTGTHLMATSSNRLNQISTGPKSLLRTGSNNQSLSKIMPMAIDNPRSLKYLR